jgi:hypothetical protein
MVLTVLIQVLFRNEESKSIKPQKWKSNLPYMTTQLCNLLDRIKAFYLN